MSCCTFFGHKNTSNKIEPALRAALLDLIENKNVNLFLVGNQGNFDSIVRKNLRQLKSNYPCIKYSVVLAYMPIRQNSEDYSDTIYPEVLERVPPKFAISKRNKWMMENSDYVITYVTHNFGGAAQFQDLAKKKGKVVINLAEGLPSNV